MVAVDAEGVVSVVIAVVKLTIETGDGDGVKDGDGDEAEAGAENRASQFSSVQ
jgi:hypothetical protein